METVVSHESSSQDLTKAAELESGRSHLYGLLSTAFLYPESPHRATFQELHEFATFLYPEILHSDGTSFPLSELQTEYISLFDGAEARRYCRPYEAEWFPAGAAIRRWEVLQFYLACGLVPTHRAHEWPDHVALELEFMHHLSLRLSGLAPAVGQNLPTISMPISSLISARRDFMCRHIHAWIPALCKRIQSVASQPFYLEVAAFVSRFLEEDRQTVLDLDRSEVPTSSLDFP